MNLHPLVSLCAGAGLAGAIVVAGTVDLTPVQPGPPTVSSDERIQELALDVPNIARFDAYYGEKKRDQQWRNLNPFVPKPVRDVEKELSDRQDVEPQLVKETPVDDNQPKPVKPDPGPPPDPDDFVPLIGADIDGFPTVVGVLAANRDLQLRVRIGAGDEAEVHAMRIGESVQGWRLESVAAGLATFRNGQGLIYPSPLRVSGTMVMTVADADAGGGGASKEGGEDESPGRRRQRPEKPDEGPSDKELAEQVLKQLRSTEQGREALKRFPSLKDRIYDDPRQAQKMIERMMP